MYLQAKCLQEQFLEDYEDERKISFLHKKYLRWIIYTERTIIKTEKKDHE